MFAMVLLVFFIGIVEIKARISAVKSKEISPKYFRLMQGYEAPEAITRSTRCFNNQFEIPLLFYVACTLYLALNIESKLGLITAWLFVGFRYIHAYIHLTYNHILHRMYTFWFAFISVMVLWVNLVIHQI
ncbi:MAPEG family protein [Oceanobacter antarcticus]|uniref:MAPEG family protein n=1 Tax=Oceanobacter antarcticus TaxID=3133425 RepID=UPI003A0FFC80